MPSLLHGGPGVSFGNPYTNNRLRDLYFSTPMPSSLGGLSVPKRGLGQIVSDAVAGRLRPVLGKRMADKAAALVDYSPVGAVTQGFEAGGQLAQGNLLGGLGNAGLAMLGAMPETRALKGYHGTTELFDQFSPELSNGLYFFADNPGTARIYGHRVKEANLKFANPMIVPHVADTSHIPALAEVAKAKGHDGLIINSVNDVGGPQRQFVAFKPPLISR